MPNVMAALPNTGGALCSMPQSLAEPSVVSATPKIADEIDVENAIFGTPEGQ